MRKRRNPVEKRDALSNPGIETVLHLPTGTENVKNFLERIMRQRPLEMPETVTRLYCPTHQALATVLSIEETEAYGEVAILDCGPCARTRYLDPTDGKISLEELALGTPAGRDLFPGDPQYPITGRPTNLTKTARR